MKKWKLALLVGVMAVGLCGCSLDKTKEPVQDATKTESTEQNIATESAVQTEQSTETKETAKAESTEQSATTESVAQTESTEQSAATEETAKTETAATESETEETVETVDLSGMNPDAADEIQHTLDMIYETIELTDKTGAEHVIKTTLQLMGVAVGNSLVEDQVELVVKDWKLRKSKEEWQEFLEKYQIVDAEYNILNSEKAERELTSAGLSITDYDYCGLGQLDMVEWIKSNLE